jgi:hypothetical protein
MRSANREVSIFNLSFIDIMSCGLGAVITLLLIAFNVAPLWRTEKDRMENLNEHLGGVEKEQEENRTRIKDLEGLLDRIQGESDAAKQTRKELENEISQLQRLNFVGIQTNRKKIVYVIDLSGSMYENPGGQAREEPYKTVIRIAKALVNVLPEDAQFNIMGFAGGDAGPDEFPQWRPGWDLHAADPTNRVSAKKRIEEIITSYKDRGMSTPTGAALRRAFKFANVEAIVVITDGEPNGDGDPQSENEYEAWIRRIRTANENEVEIHCVGVGPKLYQDAKFRKLLRSLARENGKGGFTAFD